MTCPTCSAALDDDQRYCLNCGRRVGEGRDALLRALVPAPVAAPAAPAVPPGARLWSPVGGAALAGLLVAGLVLGLLLGGGDEQPPTVVRIAAPPAPDVRVNVAGGGGAEATPVALESDWPGDDGWTVQLQTLPKDGSSVAEVQAAKASAEEQGAADVGALDSDEWPTLDPGDYVVYSGVFTSRKQATRAQRRLRRDFPDAMVVRVAADGGTTKVDKDAEKQSDEELKDLQSAEGEEYVKKSKKLPDKVATEGKVPKKDNGKAGGGSKATVLE
jgi:hypothetical protein